MRNTGDRAIAAVLWLVLCAAGVGKVDAQWSVTTLPSPDGKAWSVAHGVFGGNIVGEAEFEGKVRPVLWVSSSSSWADLTPPNAVGTLAVARAVYGSQQVGSAEIPIDENGGASVHAGRWSGSAESWVDLNPSGPNVRGSEGLSLTIDQQVGVVIIENDQEPGLHWHASLWSGTPGSWIDLHPEGATDSVARGVSNGHQVGDVAFADTTHAALWHGSAATWTDLNPPTATSSWATGIWADEQVGQAIVGGVARASLWKGSASTWVDLHPQGLVSSAAVAAFDGWQAGLASDGTNAHACVWRGSRASREDIHALLPADFTDSQAEAVWSDSAFVYVAGSALRSTTGQWQAVLWTKYIGGGLCLADFNHDGFVNGDDYDAFADAFDQADAAADVNGDGFVNGDDYDAFADAFDSGC